MVSKLNTIIGTLMSTLRTNRGDTLELFNYSSSLLAVRMRVTDKTSIFKLADGRTLGSILPGDFVDGAQVIIAERIPYKGAYTYDILPSGDTGTYWANGVPVRSTIK